MDFFVLIHIEIWIIWLDAAAFLYVNYCYNYFHVLTTTAQWKVTIWMNVEQ